MNRFRWAAALVLAGALLIASCATGGGAVVGGNYSPNAVATADVTEGAAPLTVHFTGAASSDPEGSALTYSWNFGDGSPTSTSTLANPSHTYTAEGSYPATLLVADDFGATGFALVTIQVGPVGNTPPVAVAGATPNPVKVGKTVTFSSAGSGDSDGTITYEWDFGDSTSTSSAQNPTHVYSTAGPKVASLKVTDDDGAVNTATVTVTVNPNQAPTAVAGATPNPVKVNKQVAFSSAGSSDDGTIVSYSWSFSGGGSSNVANPSHTFSTTGAKTATLTVTDDNGVTGTATVNVTVNPNQAPTAVANATPSSGQTPLTVQFNSSTLSNDPDGTIVSRSWNFGGGNTSTSANPSFTFTTVGTHTVTLTVTDDDGATGTDTIPVTVSPIPNAPPVAQASGTPTSGKEDLVVGFSSAGSFDPEGGTLIYAWNFGDGSATSTLPNPSHTYLNPGDYVATLTVTDPANGQASATVAIHVTPNAVPNAAASANPLTIRPNLLVTFSSASSTDDGTITSRSWNFGDGTAPSTAANPTHSYTTTGTKTVTLTVTDDNGAIDTDTVTITVVPNGTPTAVANLDPQSGASPLVVSFNGSSSTDPEGLPLTYSWNFGDGSATSTAANPSHTYSTGTYTATLTVTDDLGATNSATVAITAGAAGLDAPTSPVVLTGANLPALVGTAPGNIVAFKFNVVGGAPVWSQVPVQVDQRKVVAFGSYPGANDFTGTTGTVYGEASGGSSMPLQASQTAVQYADANTWVGADSNANFDADDELVFMAFDAGVQAQGANPGQPSGVVAGSGVAVQVQESGGGVGWVYLYVRSGSLDPAAGKNYVTYNFALTSGNYKTTYKRWWVAGPPGNPETSSVVTPSYTAKFTDRWKETDWQVTAAGASGVDILDAAGKVQLSPTDCATRNNKTLSEGEGAFVANIDGPVRAIRSYVGANSGPNTQRTHFMYRDREDVVFDLRVHSIPSFMDYVDYNSAASGMTYRSSTVPGGVTVNGVHDTVPTALPTWEAVNGPQGTVISTMSLTSSVQLGGTIESYYRDQTTATDPQCWTGNASLYGASGVFLNTGVPDTDPAYTNPPASVQWSRTTTFGSPVADPSTIPATAAAFQQDVANPVTTTVTAYTG